MQPPQGPNQPPYQAPQQPQPPYQQPQPYQQPYNQNPYQRGYEQRPGRGYGTASAGGFDIFMGVLLILMSLGGLLIGGSMLFVGGMVASGQASTGDNPFTARFTGMGQTVAFIIGGVFLIWSILMFASAIGIFRFRKWALITTGIQGLISAAYYGYTLYAVLTTPPANTQGALVITIVFIAISLLYTIYGFARASAAS